jgi:hypothetical protein
VWGYETVWCAAAGLAVIWAARRFVLTGDRAFALQLALTFGGLCAAESLLIAPAPQFVGLRVDQWAELATMVGAVVYLYRTRRRRGPDVIVPGHVGRPPAAAKIATS